MFTKIMAFAMAIASRGILNTKIDIDTKKLRYVSCFGLDDILPCRNLEKSTKSNYHYCKGCGCGDHSHTWLQKEDSEYSKLDYPSLECPLKMPGFTNYDPNNPSESLQRKKQIECMDPEKFKFISLTVSVDEEKQRIFEKLNKMSKNS